MKLEDSRRVEVLLNSLELHVERLTWAWRRYRPTAGVYARFVKDDVQEILDILEKEKKVEMHWEDLVTEKTYEHIRDGGYGVDMHADPEELAQAIAEETGNPYAEVLPVVKEICEDPETYIPDPP